ncbi:MAG TPA: TonB-dependent receptor, partial [Steroidobacteraceae bacterium]|nr:TonB-dependent receptor [Steroidobacteraceae bacterium]
EGSYGEYDRWSLKAAVNVPVTETFFMRLNGFVEQGDGYSDNLFLGTDVNDVDGYGGRVAMRWLPADTVTVDFSADYYKSDQAGLYASDVAGIIRPWTGSYFDVVSGTDTSNVGETYGAALTVNWDLGGDLELQSITGFRNVYQRWNLDLTDQPESVFRLWTINDTDSLSQELKLNGTATDDRLKYTVGAFWYEEENYSFIGDEINLWFPGPNRVPLPFLSRVYDMDVTSYAFFAELQYALSDRLTLIAGGRYTNDDKDLDITAYAGGEVGLSPVGGVVTFDDELLESLGTPMSLDFDKFTPKLGLQYFLSEDANLYFTWARGWKSGGWSARTNDPAEFVVFEPETVYSYELGLKTTVGDGRARLNYTAFYYDYTDFFSTATGQDGNFIVFNSDAEFYGLEFEGTVRVTENFDVFAALGWQEGEYKDRDPEVFGTSIGEEPQRMPKWSSKVGGTYIWPLAGGSSVQLTADYQFLEDHYTNLQNSELARSGDVHIVNASIGYSFGADDRYSFSLSCTNCFDNEYITQSLDFSGINPRSDQWDGQTFNGLSFLTVYAGPPRLWRATLKANF